MCLDALILDYLLHSIRSKRIKVDGKFKRFTSIANVNYFGCDLNLIIKKTKELVIEAFEVSDRQANDLVTVFFEDQKSL